MSEHDNLPVIPPLPHESPHDLPGNKAVAKCGECGRIIYQIEGYYCRSIRCPVQMHEGDFASKSTEPNKGKQQHD